MRHRLSLLSRCRFFLTHIGHFIFLCAVTAYAPTSSGQVAVNETSVARMPGQLLNPSLDLFDTNAARSSDRKPFFGDLHVHTKWSFDAFAFGTIATPRDAYRYALGYPINHPSGYQVKLRAPLDFYAVTDHAGFLGALNLATDPTTEFGALPFNAPVHDLNASENRNNESVGLRGETFSTYLAKALGALARGEYSPRLLEEASRSAWHDIIQAADEYYDPGRFTTFAAYEYTATALNGGNLHRNVIFRDSDRLPEAPFSSLNSRNPEDLWDWLDALRREGVEALAIPHNANASNGQMFALVDWAGDPLDDEYSAKRIRNEPLIEITQIKGTSETHPVLSTRDEWADFEIMPYLIGRRDEGQVSGSYIREALIEGLGLEEKNGVNPFEFGFVGASDSHTGAASIEEPTYSGKLALLDGNPAFRGSIPLNASMQRLIEEAGRQTIIETPQGKFTQGAYETWSAAGLTGVWAEENSRASLYAAFRRKETFATSGPRIAIRLFGFKGDRRDLVDTDDVLRDAYSEGVSMGSRLTASANDASFLVWALRDPHSAPLQRLQIVKGWWQDGVPQERVFDVACAVGEVDSQTHRCASSFSPVDIESCEYETENGASELQAIWRDPTPNLGEHTAIFYYARVLENPTCRWSTWDAVRAGVQPRQDLPATIQERAWSSPIWLYDRT
jgi:hypothetical protein